MTTKMILECGVCQTSIGTPADWYFSNRQCPLCGSVHILVRYLDGYKSLSNILSSSVRDSSTCGHGMWRYFDYLPIRNKGNVQSSGEGGVALERWEFLEKFAARRGVKCKVYAHRHDNNPSTGTFKDLAGSVVSSVLKEAGVRNVVVASTGNIGVALARYLAAAKINLYAFIPESSSPLHSAEIGIFGQKVFRVQGDYAKAKTLAAEFSKRHNFLLSPGGFDPIRMEAKKTISFEWWRQLGRMPTVYIQALSGGMGPIGIAKGIDELSKAGMDVDLPRFVLVQADHCAPMATAWREAIQSGFSAGWKNRYPVIENPVSSITTLATGRPSLYPFVSDLVYRTGGTINTFPESTVPAIARWVAIENAVRIGPAAAVAVGGFVNSLKSGDIRDDDEVVLAIGEGIRRSPDFMLSMDWASVVSDTNQCEIYERSHYKEQIVRTIEALATGGNQGAS